MREQREFVIVGARELVRARVRARLAGLLAVMYLVGATGCASGADHATGPSAHDGKSAAVAAQDGIARLAAGNQRFNLGQMDHPHQTPDRREELANSQQPFAVILSCSDSRTAPELLFDQGLGDLFVVRVAGNVLDDHALGSIEYAAEHLHAPLVVVMGHERCGAIKAAREAVAAKMHGHDHIQSLVDAIEPAVLETLNQDQEATCNANIENVVKQLRTSEPVLQNLVKAGQLTVMGAYYDLDSGVVTFMQGE